MQPPDDDFEYDFQRFMIGTTSVVPINEDIERVYRHLKKHIPKRCEHGKTELTCHECYFNNHKGYLS